MTIMLNKSLRKTVFFIITLVCFNTCADALLSFRGPHRISLGPEFYFMQRNKEGGSKQRGFLYGGRFTYDRIRRSALYWGIDAMYAAGKLCGHNSLSEHLRSRKRDSSIEGHFGYTFKKTIGCSYWLTPYVGGGYFEGTNRFVAPSPMQYKITNRFPYILAGFISRVDFKNGLGAGINFKAQYSIGACSKITEDPDPEVDNSRLIIEDKFSYEVDIPLYYKTCYKEKKVELSFSPFYRFRHYGAHENHPFDFIDTRFHIYGARLMFGIYF